MRVEIPECKRCCCCFPLRHGILVFGYINLLFFSFVVGLEVFVSFQYESKLYTMALYKGVPFHSRVWLAWILYISEKIFYIILLVGAHKKNTRLMRSYYYYGVTTTLASLVIFIVVSHEEQFRSFTIYLLEGGFVISISVLQVNLLLLVRSELGNTWVT